MSNREHKAFTSNYNGKVLVLDSPVGVSIPILGVEVEIHEFMGIWDTGATGTVITKKVADILKLKPTGVATVNHANGKANQNTYLVNVMLPNDVVILNVNVTEGILPGDAELLIGMDIISLGDFSITYSNEGNTTLSYCIPSMREVDYVKKINDKKVSKRKLKSKRVKKKKKKK